MTKVRNKKRRIIIILTAFAIIVLLEAWGYALETVNYTVSSSKVSSPVRIVFISDLHNGFYGGKDQSGIWDEIQEQDPDIVLFGGDLIDMYGGFDSALKLAGLVKAEYPCAYTPGNHEMMRSDRQDFYDQLDALGVPRLEGSCTEFTVNDQKIRICGIIDTIEYGKNGTQLENCCELLDEDCYNVLLSHQPEQTDTCIDAAKEVPFDLILSGHAHGGQWEIPFILEQGLYAPDQGIFPERTKGMYEYGDTVHIISKGLARPLRMIFIPRIFNRPELTVIDIEAAAEDFTGSIEIPTE